MAQPEAVVTSLPPKLDQDSALRWQEKVRQHLAEGYKLHVVDVDAVDLLSATVLGFLIDIMHMVRAAGGSIGLVATRDKALHTLGVTGLSGVFRIGRSVPEAIALITRDAAPSKSKTAGR